MPSVRLILTLQLICCHGFIHPTRSIIGRKLASSPTDDAPEPTENWKAFRNKLISGGFGLKETEGAEVEEESDDVVKSPVAPRNEALLRLQNPELADEYANGAWAHAIPGPETGGLLLRRPFEAQLITKPGPWKKIILKAAKRDFEQSTKNMDSGGAGLGYSGGSFDYIGSGAGPSSSSEERFKAWTSNAPYMFRLTERILKKSLKKIVAAMKENPRKTPLKKEDYVLLNMFQNYSKTWQEVCLIVDYSPSEGATAVVINRPLAQGLSPQLAALLFGGKPCLETVLRQRPFSDQETFARFAVAFTKGVVYNGGPDDQEGSGLLVHGLDHVHEATEAAHAVKVQAEAKAAAEAAAALAAKAKAEAEKAEKQRLEREKKEAAAAAAAAAAGKNGTAGGEGEPPGLSGIRLELETNIDKPTKRQLERMEKRKKEAEEEEAKLKEKVEGVGQPCPSKEIGSGCRIYTAEGALALGVASQALFNATSSSSSSSSSSSPAANATAAATATAPSSASTVAPASSPTTTPPAGAVPATAAVAADDDSASLSNASASSSPAATSVLDFRLFVGRKKWGPGELEKEVRSGLWQCAATARPLALKQCLSLPKPLWHEVMETIGGECAQLSKFEYLRRTDLSDDQDTSKSGAGGKSQGGGGGSGGSGKDP